LRGGQQHQRSSLRILFEDHKENIPFFEIKLTVEILTR
jgi:hypothetical protein